MECADKRIGRASDDSTALDAFPRLFVRPLFPQPSHYHVALIGHGNGIWLLLRLLPFIESIGDNEAALTLLPSVTKCRCGIDRLRTCIDRGEAYLDVLRPPRNKPPAHLLRDPLAVRTANGHQHRIGRADVP